MSFSELTFLRFVLS
jgi:hypothetical protein